MDSNGLMGLNREKKNEPLIQSGINAFQNEEEIKKTQALGEPGNAYEIPQKQIVVEKKDKKEAANLNNKKLVQKGEAYIGGIAENEIELDEENVDFEKIDLDMSRISRMRGRALNAGENRLLKLGNVPEMTSKKSVKAASSLRVVGNMIVKNGRFSKDAIRAGLDFMKKVDKWAGRQDNPSETEKDFYNALGSSDSIDFLYVDGKPIREFVSEKYGYMGADDKQKEKSVLSAYAAMITYRQNHAITLVRPTYINGHADVDIRNLTVDMSELVKGRNAKVKVIGNNLNGENYRKYCESVYRSEMRAKSAKAAINAEKLDNIEGIDKLTELKEQLKEAGKGSHQNYDDFVWAFNRYYDAVITLSSDPGDMRINRATLETLEHLNTTATSAAIAYLKGKKMNLPRHKAVEGIRSFLSAQAGQFGKYLRELAKDQTGEKTVALSDLLAEEDAGFVVVGIEEEIQTLRRNSVNVENDLNQYAVLDEDVGLSLRQKKLLKLKNEINEDEIARGRRQAFLQSLNNPDATDEVKLDYALTFLQCASSALLKNDEHLRAMRKRYPYAADNTDVMLAIIARTQLTQIYSDEFKNIPALSMAMEMWNERISSEEAKAMTYQSNFVGDRISKKDFYEKGGSAYKHYVTRMEANEITAATNGFLAAKEVKGRSEIVQLVPSMPEFTTLYKGEATEKRIPLRKTIKTMFKTFARLSTDENGHVKAQIGKFEDETITYWIDRLLRTAGTDESWLRDAERFIFAVVQPEMKSMFEEEYRQKNIWGYRTKAHNDAVDVCENYLELVKGCYGSLVTAAPDVSLDSFVHYVNYLNNVTTEDVMKFKKFGEYKINGRLLTAEEVTEALEDFKAEIKTNESEFAGFRNLDTDDVEMPSVTSCNDNAQMNEVTMTFLVNDSESHARLDYEFKSLVKTNPNEAIDRLMANLDNIIIGKYKSQEKQEADKKMILELNEKRKTGELSKIDKDNLKTLYAEYAKYDWHRGANLGKVGNSRYTTETMAPLPNEIIKSPFTNKILIGKYNSEKPMTTDDETGVQRHESMNNFYDHDDAFVHCKDHKQVVKIAVKEILRQMVDKVMK